MRIVIPLLNNAHGHLRQLPMLTDLVRIAAMICWSYLAMPNLLPPILRGKQAVRYRRQIKSNVPKKKKLHVIATIKIREDTTPAMIRAAWKAGVRCGKVYPKGRTTHADDGVTNYTKLWPVFREMQKLGMRVLFHPEHPNQVYMDRDAEYAFLEIFRMIHQAFPKLLMSWEHLSDGRCIPHLKEMAKSGKVIVTITAHHLLGHEGTFYGDPRGTCRPPFRTEADRVALIQLILEGFAWVLCGLDDAPHPKEAKLPPKGRCACGAMTLLHAPLLIVTALREFCNFDDQESLDKLIAFTSGNASRIYNIPVSNCTLVIVDRPTKIPLEQNIGGKTVMPFMAGETLTVGYEDEELHALANAA